MIHNYRKLAVWQRAVELCVDTYRATDRMPEAEVYGLTSQVRRAATSISANIAEGAGRGTTGEFRYFIRIARGSANELESHLIVARHLQLIEGSTVEALIHRADELKAMLHSLAASLAPDPKLKSDV